MQRDEVGERDYGTVHVHLFESKIRTQATDHRVGLGDNIGHKKISERRQ